MASVRILSVNCQGLDNIVKRTDVFNYLKKKAVQHLLSTRYSFYL